jgi:hypothetical protein
MVRNFMNMTDDILWAFIRQVNATLRPFAGMAQGVGNRPPGPQIVMGGLPATSNGDDGKDPGRSPPVRGADN